MGQAPGVSIVNLNQFRASLKLALGETPRELTKALKVAGAPLASAASGYAPRRTGKLAGGYKVSVRGTTGSIVNRVPYARGAEWGLHGKWKGFTRYPAFGTGKSRGRGRFAARAVVENAEEIGNAILRGMADIVSIHGWAR